MEISIDLRNLHVIPIHVYDTSADYDVDDNYQLYIISCTLNDCKKKYRLIDSKHTKLGCETIISRNRNESKHIGHVIVL